MSSTPIEHYAFSPGHVFISFAHEDREIVAGIVARLTENDIPVWTDYESLEVGTPDWEEAVRDAIDRSQLVFLIASPSSRSSPFVRSELTLAQSIERPIFPLWISGEVWVDSVPLGFGSIQHIDCRREKLYEGVSRAIEILLASLNDSHPDMYLHDDFRLVGQEESGCRVSLGNIPPSHVSVELSEYCFGFESENAFVFKDGVFETVRDLLDQLYVSALHERFPPFTYGVEWVLLQSQEGWFVHSPSTQYAGRMQPCRLLLPLDWLESGPQGEDPLMSRWKLETKPGDYGLVAGTNWSVATVESIHAFGLAVDDPRVLRNLTYPKSRIRYLMQKGYFEIEDSPKALNLTDYALTAVLELESYLYSVSVGASLGLREGCVLVQRRALSKEDSVWLRFSGR